VGEQGSRILCVRVMLLHPGASGHSFGMRYSSSQAIIRLVRLVVYDYRLFFAITAT
jgi:hypothetical protein